MSAIPSKEELYKALEMRHGEELQKKFSESHVAVCGLGGLGSNIAVHLARCGIGHLHLIDFDEVDISNINRQQYLINQIGTPKTDALKENLLQIAPYCEIKTDYIKMSDSNTAELLADDTYVCEAFDNAECKAMLVNNVLENMPDKYIVSASGMAGYGSSNTIHTKRITKHFYLCGDEVSDNIEIGTLYSPRVALCAAHQANMIIRIISGNYEP